MHLETESSDFLVLCYQRARRAASQQCHCRQCGVRCWPLSNICEVCGTQDPVRLPFVWLCYAAAGVVVLGALSMWVF